MASDEEALYYDSEEHDGDEQEDVAATDGEAASEVGDQPPDSSDEEADCDSEVQFRAPLRASATRASALRTSATPSAAKSSAERTAAESAASGKTSSDRNFRKEKPLRKAERRSESFRTAGSEELHVEMENDQYDTCPSDTDEIKVSESVEEVERTDE